MKNKDNSNENYSKAYYENRPPHDVNIQTFVDICKAKDEMYKNDIPLAKQSRTVSTPFEIQLARVNSKLQGKNKSYPPEDI
jgi:hypothetical protein